jgi:hypothetical protein
MGRLPQELVDQISGHLSYDDLENTLLVSNLFHFPAERYSGAFGKFALNEHNAQKCVEIYSGHRFFYLRKLELQLYLPYAEYTRDELRNNSERLSENGERFTHQIATFLGL